MENIDLFESFILKPVSGPHVLPELCNEDFQMYNRQELVTAHPGLVLEANTNQKPRTDSLQEAGPRGGHWDTRC